MLGVCPRSAAAIDSPAAWPEGGAAPSLDANAYTVRWSGQDRYGTNLAATLGLVSHGAYPFSTPHRTADAWGAGTCPRSVLITAGDTFADALVAASLSDPTNRGDEPQLARVAAADPEFDPIGQLDRVDTEAAPVVVTPSARSAASALGEASRQALDHLVGAPCRSAREAVIIGGRTAVPQQVERELIALGFTEVFRVGGPDRYATAAAVAEALGTEEAAPDSECSDPDASDGIGRMGFYGNSVAEFRFTSTSCILLDRAVVLAEGGTGADALAAGWWTSYWQVPVLLVAPDGSLPADTRSALGRMDIDNVIVLGGTARIPESTVDEAGTLARAAVGRIAGRDRYATSVLMAQQFGGWYPGRATAAGAASIVCLAPSAGSGREATGWPDALTAGPWCGRAIARGLRAPQRVLPPVDGHAAGVHALGGRPTHDAVPILLTDPHSERLPSSVASLLDSMFRQDATWCDGKTAAAGCLEPGFGVTFGGRAAVPDAAVDELALLLSGGSYSAASDRHPGVDAPFVTSLDLSPVFDRVGDSDVTAPGVCVGTGALRDVRWLGTWAEPERLTPLVVVDLPAEHGYGLAGRSRAMCLRPGSGMGAYALGVSLSGTSTDVLPFGGGRPDFGLSGRLQQLASTPGDGRWRSEGAPSIPVTYRSEDRSAAVDRATLDLQLSLTSDRTGSFVASGRLHTAYGDVIVASAGEAVEEGGVWRFRGRCELRPGDGADVGVVGGFVADIEPGLDPVRMSWQVDGTSR